MSNDTPKVQNNDEVICPNCVHQFRAIPVNVQGDLAALRERLDEAERENTALRAMQVGVKCAYGYKNADGVCALGYPGCACMDDLCATMEWGPDDLHAQANRRLLERATQAERDRDEARKDAERMNKLMWLSSRDIVFFGCWNAEKRDWDDGHYPAINTSDIFVPAADAETITLDEVDSLYEMVRKYPECGAYAWVSAKRHEGKLKPWRTKFPDWDAAIDAAREGK